jgi:chromosome segregation ATPase
VVLLDDAYQRITLLEDRLSDADEAVAPWRKKLKTVRDQLAVCVKEKEGLEERVRREEGESAALQRFLDERDCVVQRHCSLVAELTQQLALALTGAQDQRAAWEVDKASMGVVLERAEEDRLVLLRKGEVDSQALSWLHAEQDKWTALNGGLQQRVAELEQDKAAQQTAVEACHARLSHLETLASQQQADWQAALAEKADVTSQLQTVRTQLQDSQRAEADGRRQVHQLQQHITDLHIEDVINAKNVAEVRILEMEMKSRVDAADLLELRTQQQALVLEKVTFENSIHLLSQEIAIHKEEIVTLRRHLEKARETAGAQERELREGEQTFRAEMAALRKEYGDVKLVLETDVAGLRAGEGGVKGVG